MTLSQVVIRKIIFAREDSKEFVTRIQWHQSHILWLIKQVLHPAWHTALIWFISSQAGGRTEKAAIHECFRTGHQGPSEQNLHGPEISLTDLLTKPRLFPKESWCIFKKIHSFTYKNLFFLKFFSQKTSYMDDKRGECRENRRNAQISDLTTSNIKSLVCPLLV